MVADQAVANGSTRGRQLNSGAGRRRSSHPDVSPKTTEQFRHRDAPAILRQLQANAVAYQAFRWDGLSGESGVVGGIVAVVPGQFGIGIFSPPLDAKGNSVRGVQVCRELSERFGLHAFEAGHKGPSLEDQFRPRRA